MGGDPPRTKTIFVRVPRAKISKGQMWEGSPPRGRNRKSSTPPKFSIPIFSKNHRETYIQNFRDKRGPEYMSICKFVENLSYCNSFKVKNKKNSLWGAWPPNLTPEPHDPRNLSGARRGAHDPEQISKIAQAVAEKIEFEKNSLAPPGGQTESSCVKI